MASSPNFGMPGMPGMDAWNSFWSDFLSKSMPAGASPMAPPAEFAERMRKSFFEAMSKYFEEYLRSEAFLNSMKQSMDHALAWQQAIKPGTSLSLEEMRVLTTDLFKCNQPNVTAGGNPTYIEFKKDYLEQLFKR